MDFASRERVTGYQELANDFVRRVLALPWAFISDESTLGDFQTGETTEVLLGRIKEIYRVDASDIVTGNLADILDRIAESQRRAG